MLDSVQQLFYSIATSVLGSASVYVAFDSAYFIPCVGIPTAVIEHIS